MDLNPLKRGRPTLATTIIALAIVYAPFQASAITVELAKKCNVLLAKEFPPREAGNPAAGSAKGTAQSARAYFNKCVANAGNMDTAEPKSQK